MAVVEDGGMQAPSEEAKQGSATKTETGWNLGRSPVNQDLQTQDRPTNWQCKPSLQALKLFAWLKT